MKAIIQQYARDNGHNAICRELIEIANALKNFFNTISYEKWDKLKRKEKLDLCWNYLKGKEFQEFLKKDGVKLILEDEYEIKIIDKCLDQYGNSWGYQEVQIILVKDSNIDYLKNEIKKIDNDSKWEINFENLGNMLQEIIDEYNIETGDCINGKTVKEIIEKICETLENNYDDPAILYGYESYRKPIYSTNSFTYAGDSFDYEIKEDEITIIYHYTELAGAHYHLFKDEIIFKKLEQK